MTTAMVGVGEVVASQSRQELLAQAVSDVVAREQSMDGALSEKHGHEEWTHRLEDAWAGHLDTLQQCVCELLRKNQQLRMALAATNGEQQQRKNFRSR